MLIGELSTVSGFTKDTIRYYEKMGLLTSKLYEKSESGYRYYKQEAVQLLQFIRMSKDYGFTLNEIKNYYNENEGIGYNCKMLIPIIEEKIKQKNKEIALLNTQKERLEEGLNILNERCSV